MKQAALSSTAARKQILPAAWMFGNDLQASDGKAALPLTVISALRHFEQKNQLNHVQTPWPMEISR